MTYEEAKQLIDDNKKALDIYITHSDPPHRVLGTLVSNANSDINTEAFIFTQMQEHKRDNKEILDKLNMLKNDLKPFVVILFKGNNLVQPLESYLGNSNFFTDMGNS